jgi:hypothetical protein
MAVVGCSSESRETTSVEAPIVAGLTDDAFRAAAGCSDCAVTARSTVTLPLTGKVFTEVKLASASPPVGYSTALDSRGNVVDPRVLLAAEGAAKIARQGKLRDDAYARSLTSSPELVPISIWADFGDRHAPRQQIISNASVRAAHKAQTASRLHAVTAKVTHWLDARGFQVYDRGIDTPVITAAVPASALAALGRLDSVAIVHLRYPDVPAGFTWYDAVKGPFAHVIVGSASGMAYCNGEGWQPDDYTYLTPYQRFDATGTVQSHTRWTSELISATASTRMAPGASPYIANWVFTPVEKYTAWQWCYSQDIHNLNRSAGTSNGPIGALAEDMAQDYYAYHWPYPLITLSAGNCVNSFGPVDCAQTLNGVHVTNRSYNTLVVGASDSNTTGGTSDDFLADFSQYANPVTTHNDFELPNLVAPGSDKFGTDISSASTVNRGTSASAPITLGTALLMKTRDSDFNGWPEMMRATIMAVSTHPVDGPRTDRLGTGADRKQGAGLLNALAAVGLANPNHRVWAPNNAGMPYGRWADCLDFATDFPSGVSAPFNINVPNNGRLRAVAAWDATTQFCNSDGSGCTGVALDGDLDLWLSKWTGSSWQLVCSSNSYDSSWELCDVAVTTGEVYKVELRLFTANTTGTCAGIAWNLYNPSME